MKSRNFFTQVLILSMFILSSCASPLKNSGQSTTNISRSVAEEATAPLPLIDTLPKLTSDNGELKAALKKGLKNRTTKISDERLTKAAEKLQNYLFFLGLTVKDLTPPPPKPKTLLGKITATLGINTAAPPEAAKEETNKDELINNEAATEGETAKEKVTETEPEKEASPKVVKEEDDTEGEGEDAKDTTPSNTKAIQRLYIASTQFLDCPSMLDWECLEKDPVFAPTDDFRTERADSYASLGSPIIAGDSLDMDVYFTQGWDGSKKSGVADRFAEKITKNATRSLSLAMYGIDDIQGSMSGVYQAITKHAENPSTKVRAVVDFMGFEKGSSPWIFNYRNLPEAQERWLFGPSIHPETPGAMRLTFQYNGTPNFLRAMNDGIASQEESRARLEWSSSRIMHNKFAVMEDEQNNKSVWTGTANISKNCMGVEANANMSVFIKNDHIAQAFLDQFNVMFEFDKTLKVKSKYTTSLSPEEPSLAGRFHRNKYPVSHRLFKFNDGTNLRVHFAPTDDAEHRVIIPMLLSARAGDLIRIAMFGGTGYEIVRAMQYAVAQGANIKIAFDRKLGHGLTSWIRDEKLNVFSKNPYIRPDTVPGKISVRVSNWVGKNHYKAGTLTRKQSNNKMLAEQIIVGSQNWSSGGNDYNDENLISIQNLSKGVKSAEMFNKEFDKRLWVKSIEEKRPGFWSKAL